MIVLARSINILFSDFSDSLLFIDFIGFFFGCSEDLDGFLVSQNIFVRGKDH